MADVDDITALALAGIDANAGASALLIQPHVRTRLPFSTLYAYASDPTFDATQTFRARLAGDPKAQHDLSRLLARVAFAHMPRQAAAASADVVRRESAQATITLTPSRTEAGQVYVIITLTDPGVRAPTRLTVQDRVGAFLDFDLGPFSAGRVQFLLAETDAVVTALRDTGTEVFLR